jgi:hypothetical protein
LDKAESTTISSSTDEAVASAAPAGLSRRASEDGRLAED